MASLPAPSFTRQLQLGNGGADRLDGLGRKDVPLMIEKFLDVMPHGRGLAHPLGKKPLEEGS